MTRRVYSEDPYRKTITTRVETCGRSDAGYEVVLADELLYPEAGGQPSDRGTIAGQPVLGLVKSDAGRAVHVLAVAVSPSATTPRLATSRAYRAGSALRCLMRYQSSRRPMRTAR